MDPRWSWFFKRYCCQNLSSNVLLTKQSEKQKNVLQQVKQYFAKGIEFSRSCSHLGRQMCRQVDADPPPQGVLTPITSRILTKVLYAARIVRPDLSKALDSLARLVARWDTVCDTKLRWLMCRVHSLLDPVQVGWVGDKVTLCEPHLSTDSAVFFV